MLIKNVFHVSLPKNNSTVIKKKKILCTRKLRAYEKILYLNKVKKITIINLIQVRHNEKSKNTSNHDVSTN